MVNKNTIDPEDNWEDEEKPISFVKMKGKLAKYTARQKSAKKASFEANADVQRWLWDQAREEEEQQLQFSPTMLVGRRDGPWILSSLSRFYKEKLITDVLYEVRSGKEASVFCCVAHPSVGVDYLAAKVYRPRMFRSLSNDAIYRHNRTHYDNQGNTVRSSSQVRRLLESAENERTRAFQVTSWIEYEYQTQSLLYEYGVDVPRPFSQIGNAMLMEYVGAVDEPAPLLRNVILTPEEARPLFDRVIRNIELCLAQGRIHGDLSAYNMLYWEGAITLIDFAQAIEPAHHSSDAFYLFQRDIERVCHYFARCGVIADAAELADMIWTEHLGPVPG